MLLETTVFYRVLFYYFERFLREYEDRFEELTKIRMLTDKLEFNPMYTMTHYLKRSVWRPVLSKMILSSSIL
jgi:hypothetical protein